MQAMQVRSHAVGQPFDTSVDHSRLQRVMQVLHLQASTLSAMPQPLSNRLLALAAGVECAVSGCTGRHRRQL